MDADARVALRARLNLRAVLPLTRLVLADSPSLARFFSGASGVVQIDAADSGAQLKFDRGALTIVPEIGNSSTVRLRFPDLPTLNRFFAGQGARPQISGLAHPLLIARTLWLLSSLRILDPERPAPTVEDRARRVRLIVAMVVRALDQLARGGHPEMRRLVENSPDRVYQWSVSESGAAGWLRMRNGLTRCGDGVYPFRRPFVQFIFPSVEGAFRVFTNTGSQMEAVQRGHVRTEGSPEYTRTMSGLMQKVDELLTVG